MTDIIPHAGGILFYPETIDGEKHNLSIKDLEYIIRWLAVNRRGFIEDSLISTEHKCAFCERD